MKRANIISMCLLAMAWGLMAQDCFRRKGCGNRKFQRAGGDYWISVNRRKGICLTCMCTKIRKFTVSCILELDASLRKSISRASLQAANAYVIKSGTNSSSVISDEYIETSEAKAKAMKCGEEPKPVYNLVTGQYVWPKMKYVHYYHTERVTNCCRKIQPKRKIPKTCVVRYTDRCEARVVSKRDKSKFCTQWRRIPQNNTDGS